MSTDNSTGNAITVLIGKNGTGKSRLLSAITRCFQAFDNPDYKVQRERLPLGRKRDTFGDFNLSFVSDGHQFNLTSDGRNITFDEQLINSNVLPRKIIATSNSPFDKFPIQQIDRREIFLNSQHRYKYLGTKNKIGQHSAAYQLSRVIESLFIASEKGKEDLDRLAKIFVLLGYRAKFKVHYRYRPHIRQLAEMNSINGVFEHLQRFARTRWAIKENRLSDEDAEKILIACHSAVNNAEDSRYPEFEVDFTKGGFTKGSLSIFEDTAILREIGLMDFDDLTLTLVSEENHELSIREASSGEQCFLSLILGIASEITDNSLICIDEPEISLHPEWQEQIVEVINNTFSSFHGCHFIIATHSPQIIAKISSESCSVLTLDDGHLHPSSEFRNRSSDYQLAKLFKTPGFRNEYLTKECVKSLSLLSKLEKLSSKELEAITDLVGFLPYLKNGDPVKDMIEIIIDTLEKVKR